MPSPRPTDDNQLPALREFLSSGKTRRLSGREVREFVAEVFAAARAADQAGLPEESHPHRVMSLYRIGRQIALMVGLVSHDETLEDGLETLDESFWTAMHPIVPPSHDAVPLAGAASQMHKAWLLATDAEAPAGLSILPPPGYEERQKWCRVASQIALALGLERHEVGIAGTFGLLDVDGAGRCDVHGGELISFEDKLVDLVLELFLDKGSRAVKRVLRDEYGIGSKEGAGIMRLAKTTARRETEGSIDEKRAIHERRLESYISRCKDTMDMEGEMKALKELARAQGLTRTAPEDREREFLDALRSVAARQDAQQLSAADQALVQGRMEAPRAIEATPVDDLHDQEALAEYDRENRR
jgi:hypothetical protein